MQVRLENKISVHHGILCLNVGSLRIMGGLVQSLYDEWQMSRKYSGFSRSLKRLSQNDEDPGPPQFEKLRIEPCPRKISHVSGSHHGEVHSYSKRIIYANDKDHKLRYS